MIKNIIQEGFALKNKGYYKRAIEVFYKALEFDSNSLELLQEIAELYYLLGNEEKALSYIEQILNKDAQNIVALKFLKKIFEVKGALNEAEQTAKNIYCISRKNADLVEIFKLLIEQNKFDEVFEYKIDAPSSFVLLEIAKAHYFKKEYEKALDILINITDIKEDKEYILLLGEVYYALKMRDKCIDLANCFVIEDSTSEQLNFVGLVELYLENYKKAIACFQKAIKKDSKNSEYYFNLANVFFKQGDLASAKKQYNMAISLSPNNQHYHFALSNLYYTEKHYKKALEELTGDFFEAKLLKSIILYDAGYLALSKRELNSLIEENPNSQIVKDYIHRINLELGLS